MSCDHIEIDGVTAIVCSRGTRSPRCSVPGCNARAGLLCDFPIKRRGGAEGTCDRKLCSAHAVEVGNDRHFCAPHARVESRP